MTDQSSSSKYDYSQYEHVWEKTDTEYSRLLAPYLQNFLQTNINKNIIEIGFGNGHIAFILKTLGYKKSYIGFDNSENALDYVNLKFASSQDKSIFSFVAKLTINGPAVKAHCQKLSTQPEIAIFCLSACEMDSSTLKDYLQALNGLGVQKILLVEPSSLTFYYPTIFYKTWWSKILARLGQEAAWRGHGLISGPRIGLNQNYYTKKIRNNPNLKAVIHRRSMGDLIDLSNQSSWVFESYKNLEFTENSIKIAPVSKFEILIVSRK